MENELPASGPLATAQSNAIAFSLNLVHASACKFTIDALLLIEQDKGVNKLLSQDEDLYLSTLFANPLVRNT